MDFILGSIIALGSAALTIIFKKYIITNKTKVQVLISQSKMYDAIADKTIMIPMRKEFVETQSTMFYKRNSTRILFTEDNAYWIKNNNVYRADIGESGEILEESAKPLDMMSMDKVQLDEMMFIVEKLTEGNNDNRSAGN